MAAIFLTTFTTISLVSSGHIALAWIIPNWPEANWLVVTGVGAVAASILSLVTARSSEAIPGPFAEGVLAARGMGAKGAFVLRGAWIAVSALMLGALTPLLIETVVFPILLPYLSDQAVSMDRVLVLYLHPSYRSWLIAVGSLATLMISVATFWLGVRILRRTWSFVLGAITLLVVVAWVVGGFVLLQYEPDTRDRPSAARNVDPGRRFYENVTSSAQERNRAAAQQLSRLANAATKDQPDVFRKGGDVCAKAEAIHVLAPEFRKLLTGSAVKEAADYFQYRTDCLNGQLNDAELKSRVDDQERRRRGIYPATKVTPKPSWTSSVAMLMGNRRIDTTEVRRTGREEAHFATVPGAVVSANPSHQRSKIRDTSASLLVGIWIFFAFFALGESDRAIRSSRERRQSLAVGGIAAILLAMVLLAFGEIAVTRTLGPVAKTLWADFQAGDAVVPPNLLGAVALLKFDPLWTPVVGFVWTAAFFGLFLSFITSIWRNMNDLLTRFRVDEKSRRVGRTIAAVIAIIGAFVGSTNSAFETQMGVFVVMSLIQMVIVDAACIALARPSVHGEGWSRSILLLGGTYTFITLIAVVAFMITPPEGAFPRILGGTGWALLAAIAGAIAAGSLYVQRSKDARSLHAIDVDSALAPSRNNPPQRSASSGLRLLIADGLRGSDASLLSAIGAGIEYQVDAIVILGPLHASRLCIYEETDGRTFYEHSFPFVADRPRSRDPSRLALPAEEVTALRNEWAALDAYAFACDAPTFGRFTRSDACWRELLAEVARQEARRWERLAYAKKGPPVVLVTGDYDPPNVNEAVRKELNDHGADGADNTGNGKVADRRIVIARSGERLELGAGFELLLGDKREEGGGLFAESDANGSLNLWAHGARPPEAVGGVLIKASMPPSLAEAGGFRGLLLSARPDGIEYLLVVR